ncbi:hypothetical protein CK203_050596 [Vitis vinifera]|uniref:Uncharacterized protein n=1 Tax=Vitis vinifera TaxID=29760 RepID=A0A438GFK9_VITVI|nr:hypothetical protein CK203_050596 [Vitis vinifera]
MERGVRGSSSGRVDPSCLLLDGLDRSGSLAFLSAPLLDACPATKTCWVAACTSSSSIEYLLARRNKSSIVVGGFLVSDSKNGVPGQMLRLKICRTASMLVLMFCFCRAEHKFCPTKASDRKAWRACRPSLLLMEPTGGWFGRFLPACCTAWYGGTFYTIRVTIGSGCGGTFRAIGVTIGSGFQGLLLLSQGILTLGQALSLLPGLLNAVDGEAPLMKPGCATPHFLLLIFCLLEESLQLSLACQLSSLNGLAPFRVIFLSLADEWLLEGVVIYVVVPAKDIRTGCLDTPSDGFVSHVVAGPSSPYGRLSEIVESDLPSFLSFHSAGDGMWAVAGCRDDVVRFAYLVNDPDNISG